MYSRSSKIGFKTQNIKCSLIKVKLLVSLVLLQVNSQINFCIITINCIVLNSIALSKMLHR